MKNVFINFKVGDCVKVKKGIVDPDNPEYCIENWKGKLVKEFTAEADESMFVIKWNSLTLKEMPEDLIKKSIQDGLDFSEMCLGISDIECAEPGDNEEDTYEITRELNSLYTHSLFIKRDANSKYYDEQTQRIAEILDGVDIENEKKVTKKWEKYLSDNLKFPFEAEIVELYEYTNGLDVGDVVNVKKIKGRFDSYEIVGEVRKWLWRFHLPLSNLEVCDKSSQNYINVDDYNYWYANR